MNYYIKKLSFIILMCFLFSCDSKTAEDYIREGIKFTRKQNYKKAVSSYKKAIKKDPEYPLAHHALGGIYTFKGMNEKAIEEHKKAIELDPEYPDPHYSLGFVYEKSGKKEEAEQEYLIFQKLKKKRKEDQKQVQNIDL